MSENKTIQELPDWFEGKEYTEGDKVKNPFSGEEYELNKIELSMYDFIIGSQIVFEKYPNKINDQQIKDFQNGLDWFKEINPEAYSVLLE
jgi:hypothetical protein